MPEFMVVLSPLGSIAVIYLFHILARLSQKLGEVTRMPAYYRWYRVGQALWGIALLTQLLRVSLVLDPAGSPSWLGSPWLYLLTHYLPMAVGVIIGLIVTCRYWIWLLTERD